MSEWDSPGTDPAPNPEQGQGAVRRPGPAGAPGGWHDQTPRILAAFGAVAALVLTIGIIVWISSGDDQITTSSTMPVSASTDVPLPTTAPATITPLITPPAAMPDTTLPDTTLPETTLPATTIAPTTMATPPSGDTWRVTSELYPDDPFTLRRVAQFERVAAYDGVIQVTPNSIRCVAIVIDGEDTWREWCGEADQPVNFVTLDGINPWVVEVGAAVGDIALTRQQPTWTLPMNGCTESITTLIAASLTSPAVTTGAVCVPGEAFLTNGAVLLQPGPRNSGQALLTGGDEGWDVRAFGTSLGCDTSFDGVDRCALYGVESDLFEAVLPIPPIEALTAATDLIGMTDRTAAVRSWVGAETDSTTIETLIFDELNEPGAELPATKRRAVGVNSAADLDLVLIEVPALDDSILSTTWAVWIGTGRSATVLKAYAWQTCARGMADPDTCI